jgi:hypothetical protein
LSTQQKIIGSKSRELLGAEVGGAIRSLNANEIATILSNFRKNMPPPAYGGIAAMAQQNLSKEKKGYSSGKNGKLLSQINNF